MKRKTITKDITFLVGRGIGCTCSDCPVLYGGECLTGETPKETLIEGKLKISGNKLKLEI